MEERVAIFIDGSNLYHALRDNIGRTDLNFHEFALKLIGPRKLFRVYYYNLQQDTTRNPDGAREQLEFLNILRGMPYLEVRLGSLKMSQTGPVEKGVDIMLATDLLQYCWAELYDTAILVSGDGDFGYALQTVKNRGKHIEVAYMESHASRDLLEIADVRHPLDKSFFQGLWWGKSRGQSRGRSSGQSNGQSSGQNGSSGQSNGQSSGQSSGQTTPRRRTRRRTPAAGEQRTEAAAVPA